MTPLALSIGIGTFCLLAAGYQAFFQKQHTAESHVVELADTLSQSPADRQKERIEQHIRLRRRFEKAEGEQPNKWEAWLSQQQTQLERANWPLTAEEWLGVLGIAVALTFFTLFLLLQWLLPIAALLSPVGALLPLGVLKISAWLRKRKAEEQFSEILDDMVNSFKTGYGLNKAIARVAQSFPDPWGTEFGKMAAELSFGAQLDHALHHLSDRMPLADVDLFVTAMLIQKDTGGNMVELLGNLSNACRERFKLKRKISAISAQGKLSATIISFIPVGLLAMIFCLLPGPVTAFVTNPIGIILLVLAGGWMLVGIGVLFKIVQLET